LPRPDLGPGGAVGFLGDLITLSFNAVVLLSGGVEDWRGIVALVFVAHLPLTVLEGGILGFTVGFLARVKPELLDGFVPHLPDLSPTTWAPPTPPAPPAPAIKAPAPIEERPLHQLPGQAPGVLLALATLFVLASPALAHRLEAEYRVLNDGQIEIESWYETSESAEKARVQVFGPGNELRIEGTLNAKGIFVFRPDRVEDLKVVINAGAGHRKELTIPAKPAPKAPTPGRVVEFPTRDVLIGVGFLLALASFWIGLRNARELRAIRGMLEGCEKNPSPQPPPRSGEGE